MAGYTAGKDDFIFGAGRRTWSSPERGTFSRFLDHSDRQFPPEAHVCSGPWSAFLGHLPFEKTIGQQERDLLLADVVFVAEIFERTREEGLLIRRGGLYGNVIRITPPPTTEKAEIDHAIRTLDRAFGKVQAFNAV